MSNLLILGQSNVGKTLFMIRLAELYGHKAIHIERNANGRGAISETYSLDDAVRILTGPTLNQTKGLQSVSVSIPVRKGRKQCFIIDSTGLSERIHPDSTIRLGMAETLRSLKTASIIFHLVDAGRIGTEGVSKAFSEVDYQVMQYGVINSGYAMIANKLDLQSAQNGLSLLRKEFRKISIIPVSALKITGFEEVRHFVREHL